MPHEVTEHESEGLKYRVTHEVDASGDRTGRGKVEVEQEVRLPDDLFDKKFVRTGGSYQAFLGKLAADKRRAFKILFDEAVDRGEIPPETSLGEFIRDQEAKAAAEAAKPEPVKAGKKR